MRLSFIARLIENAVITILIFLFALWLFGEVRADNTFTNNDGACWTITSNWQLYCIPFAEDTNWDNLSAYCYDKQVYYLKGTIFYMDPVDCPDNLTPKSPPLIFLSDTCSLSWNPPTHNEPCSVDPGPGCGEEIPETGDHALSHYNIYCSDDYAAREDHPITQHTVQVTDFGKMVACGVTAVNNLGNESKVSGIAGESCAVNTP